MFLDIIAMMMGVGMLGGALAGWILMLGLLISEVIVPRLREIRIGTRYQRQRNLEA